MEDSVTLEERPTTEGRGRPIQQSLQSPTGDSKSRSSAAAADSKSQPKSRNSQSPSGDLKPHSKQSPSGDLKPHSKQSRARDLKSQAIRSLTGDLKPRGNVRPPESRVSPSLSLPEKEQEAATLLSREGEALDARERERRKRRRIERVEARVGTTCYPKSESPTGDRMPTVPQSSQSPSSTSRPESRLANEERNQVPDDRAWKLTSPDGDPTSSLRRVPIDVVPIEFEKESPRRRAAEIRNSTRISEADKKDELVLSEYLPEDIADILRGPILGPDDAFDPGDVFLKRLTEVATSSVEPPRPAPFVFETTPEALRANGELIKEYGFDLESLFHDYQDTTLGYGSEFRPLDQLEKVLGGHPKFSVLSGLISNGMDYRFKKEITDKERLTELRAMMERGNHKSTEKATDTAAGLLAKDVAHGFSIRNVSDRAPTRTGAG
jgi:hypothetical protein